MSEREHKPFYRRWIFRIPLGLYLLISLAPLFFRPDFSSELPTGVTQQSLTVDTSAGPITLSYWEAGDPAGVRVILVHGTPGSAGAWSGFLSAVPPGVRYISVDRPGFGGSGVDGPQTSLRVQAEALRPLMGDGAILVGHSLGGPVVAKAAALFPDRVDGIAIVAGSLDPALEEINPLQYLAFLPPIRWTLDSSLYTSNLELFALEAELEILASQLSAITAPIEILHGTQDDLVPYANVAFMTQKMRDMPVRVTTFDGENHFLVWSHQAEIEAAIARLIEVGQ